MKYYIVDAFAEQPFGGNPAGVVLLDGDFPSDKFMQQVAAEFRYSETAFVKRHSAQEFTVRYFTPCGEVDLCGHATIATFGMMLMETMVPAGTLCLNHTLAGDLSDLDNLSVHAQIGDDGDGKASSAAGRGRP